MFWPSDMANESRAQGTDPLGPQHPQDHPDDGAGVHVQAEARPGPGGRVAPLCRGAAGGDRRPGDTGAGRAVPVAAPPGVAVQGRAEPGGGDPDHRPIAASPAASMPT